MDLRGLANSVTSIVNPNVPVSVQRSNGYGMGAGLKQVPLYATPVDGPAQIQALDNAELQHIDGINQQGTIRGIYLRGLLNGVVRPDSKGGDLVIVKSGVNAGQWLVVKILETWPDWTKAAIVYQGPA